MMTLIYYIFEDHYLRNDKSLRKRYRKRKVEDTHYFRKGIVPVPFITENIFKKKWFFGKKMKVLARNKKYRCFTNKGVKCLRCGMEGHYFAVEKQKQVEANKYHFNLYHLSEDGVETLLTIDHRIPRAKKGSNRLKNLQTMCQPCNQDKGDQLIFTEKKAIPPAEQIKMSYHK